VLNKLIKNNENISFIFYSDFYICKNSLDTAIKLKHINYLFNVSSLLNICVDYFTTKNKIINYSIPNELKIPIIKNHVDKLQWIEYRIVNNRIINNRIINNIHIINNSKFYYEHKLFINIDKQIYI
jgi:hypothetical protein